MRSSLGDFGFFDWRFDYARPNKVWFRKDIGCWMVTLGGKKHRLAEGRQNKKLAEQKFHELAAVRAMSPASPAAPVADIIERFSRKHAAERFSGNDAKRTVDKSAALRAAVSRTRGWNINPVQRARPLGRSDWPKFLLGSFLRRHFGFFLSLA